MGMEENQQRRDDLLAETNTYKDEIAAKQEEISKVKDEPHRLEKGAYILKDSCASLEKSYKENEELIKDKIKITVDQQKELDKVKKSCKDLEGVIEIEKTKLDDIDMEINKLTKESHETKIH